MNFIIEISDEELEPHADGDYWAIRCTDNNGATRIIRDKSKERVKQLHFEHIKQNQIQSDDLE